MDPLELRLRNYAEQRRGREQAVHQQIAAGLLRQGAAAFGWSSRTREPRSMRDGDVLIGWGMATATYPRNAPARRAVRLVADGTAWSGRARTISAPAPTR